MHYAQYSAWNITCLKYMLINNIISWWDEGLTFSFWTLAHSWSHELVNVPSCALCTASSFNDAFQNQSFFLGVLVSVSSRDLN